MASGDPPPNPAPQWITGRSWTEIDRLSKLPVFKGLNTHVASNLAAWKVVFDAMDPHKLPIPEPFATKLTGFQKLLVLRCLRPDKVIPAIQDFVIDRLGTKFVLPPSFNLDACYRDSSATCPLIFVLSPGSDPTAALLKYAGKYLCSSPNIMLCNSYRSFSSVCEHLIVKGGGFQQKWDNEKDWYLTRLRMLSVKMIVEDHPIPGIDLSFESVCVQQPWSPPSFIQPKSTPTTQFSNVGVQSIPFTELGPLILGWSEQCNGSDSDAPHVFLCSWQRNVR